ncbi:hypothetical protein [Nostoc sp. MS1]|nr:hypothetical protein [Nostoc sp. MS1]
MPSLREAAPTARQGRTPVPYGGKPAYRTGSLWTVDYGLMTND